MEAAAVKRTRRGAIVAIEGKRPRTPSPRVQITGSATPMTTELAKLIIDLSGVDITAPRGRG